MKTKSKTGIYETKTELIQNIHYMFHHEYKSISFIASHVQIAETRVKQILKSK